MVSNDEPQRNAPRFVHLLADVKLPFAVENRLQRHAAHPVSQQYCQMLRPATCNRRANARQNAVCRLFSPVVAHLVFENTL